MNGVEPLMVCEAGLSHHMTSRLKILACLLIIAGCVRLSVPIGIAGITGQGDRILPFQLQLAFSYLPLVTAIAVARSKNSAFWALGFAIEQTVVTFATCYLLPRRIPDDLAWIPYLAAMQFLGALILVVSVVWYQRFGNGEHAA